MITVNRILTGFDNFKRIICINLRDFVWETLPVDNFSVDNFRPQKNLKSIRGLGKTKTP